MHTFQSRIGRFWETWQAMDQWRPPARLGLESSQFWRECSPSEDWVWPKAKLQTKSWKSKCLGLFVPTRYRLVVGSKLNQRQAIDFQSTRNASRPNCCFRPDTVRLGKAFGAECSLQELAYDREPGGGAPGIEA